MQVDAILMLLVAISWTYSSSPCEQSAQGLVWEGAAGTHTTSTGETSAVMMGKDLVQEKQADVREADPAGQEEEEEGRENEEKEK